LTTTSTPTPPPSGGVGGGGGGAPVPAVAVYNVPSDYIKDDGTFSKTLVVNSPNNKYELTINEGTQAITAEGTPLSKLTVSEVKRHQLHHRILISSALPMILVQAE
jgi:hypothetical protein